MNPSSNLFIVGPTGAGKSTIGRRLADHYGSTFIDLDQQIEVHAGCPIWTIFEQQGEAKFRALESALLAKFSQYQDIVLATGAGAVLAAENRQRLQQGGYVVWLQATVEQQLARLRHDASRPLLVGDRHAKLTAMAPIRNPLYQAVADLSIPSHTQGLSIAIEQNISLLNKHWQRITSA